MNIEEKLKESVKNYKILNNELETILDLIPGILFCKDRNDVITRVNQNFADLFNSKKEDIIGKTTFDLFPKDQAENFRKDDLEVINTGKPKLNIEEVVDFPDTKIWSTTSKVPYYNDKSEINGIIGLAIDITERKKVEQNLKVAREKAESYLNLAGVAILTLDKNGNIILLNKKGYEILQYNEGELIGKNWFDICLPKDRKKDVFEIFETLMRGEIKFVEDVEDLILTKNGEERLVAWHNTLLYDKDGIIIGTLSSGEIITERKIAEQKLEDSEKQLRELNDELEKKVLSRTEALKMSEQKYKTILDGIVTGVWVADKDDNINFANKGMGKIAGIPSEQLVNVNVLNDFSEGTLKYFKPYYLKARKTLNSVFYDSVPVITPAGRQSFQSGWLIPLTKDGKFHNIICTVEDITERKKTKQNLKESEKKLRNLNKELEQKVEERTKKLKESEKNYRELLENMMEGYYALDLKGNFTFVNDYFCKTVGYSNEELIGKSYRLIYDEKSSKKIFKMFNQLYRSGIPLPHTNRAEGLTNRGKQVFLEGIIDLIYDSEGNKTGFYGFARDITEKKKAEQKLKESEEILRSTLESTADGILVVDEDGQVTHTNSKFADMWRIPQDLISERDDQKLIDYVLSQLTNPEDFISKVNQLYRSASESLDTLFFKDARVFERFSSPLIHAGEIKGRVWSFRDITERKQVEVKLREVNNLKSEFLRRASHELKTPLISIKGFSELILSLHEDQLEPSINAKLREINVGCERLQNIINNLLKTSRLESPELRPSKHREDLSFLISFCVLELESMAERRKQSIKLDIHNQLYANIEKEEIHDVLSNLLSNAIKYTPPRGIIEIKTELKEEFVVVSIKDNGIGFTDEQKKLIFQQFGKIERYGQGLDLGIDGTGLGLFISKRIVESHGGKIWMESEGKNMGSTFYFSLPKKIE